MTRRTAGLSLIELLIALSVIGIAFFALAMSQVNHLRASSRSQVLTQVKTVANKVLEQKTSEVLKAVTVTSSSSLFDQDDPETGTSLSFKFIDYYVTCRTTTLSEEMRSSAVYRSTATGVSGFALLVPADDKISPCSNTLSQDGVDVTWSVTADNGVPSGEGVLDIAVTATSAKAGTTLTIGNTITCYDVYPSPKKNAPKPCPDPAVL